jgi:hypothetical protein
VDPAPEYRRAETRYETTTGTLPVERHVTTSRFARISPAQIITGLAGIVVLVIGLITLAKGGLNGSITDPVVSVAGFDHTPLLGLIEAVFGLLLLGSALWGSRASGAFFGVLMVVAGIVIVVTPSSFASTLAAESSYGWFLIVVGGIVALACLALPDRASRVVTYR